MVYSSSWFERVVGLEVLYIGRPANSKIDCLVDLSGSQLFYRVAMRGNWLWLYGCGMDEPDQLEFLYNCGDGPSGWSLTRRFIQALERSGIKSLKERPIQLGEVGSVDAFVIG